MMTEFGIFYNISLIRIKLFPQTLLRKHSKNGAQQAKKQKTIHTMYQKHKYELSVSRYHTTEYNKDATQSCHNFTFISFFVSFETLPKTKY